MSRAPRARKKLPLPLPWRTRHWTHRSERFDCRLGLDGHVWTYLGSALVRINPANA